MRSMVDIENTSGATANRDLGEFQDVSAPGLQDGSPLRENWLNDVYYALRGVMYRAGITPDNTEEGILTNQFRDAVIENIRSLNTALDANTVFPAFWNDRDIYFSTTADRTANITAGASRQGTEITFYNSGSFNLTVTYYSTDTFVVTPNGFVKFKWNGARFKIINETRIGKIESGIIIPRGAIGLQGQLRNKDDLYKYAQTYYSSFWTTETDWQDMSKLACCKFVEYSSTQYRLPDFRGVFMRFTGANSILKTANGNAFDGGALLAILLDKMQGVRYQIGQTSFGADTAGNTIRTTVSASAANTGTTKDSVSDGTNGDPRTGNQTQPVSVSLVPYIYYED